LPLSADIIRIAQTRINELEPETLFSVVELFGELWPGICEDQETNERGFGQMFSRAVAQGHLSNLVFIDIPTSGRYNRYRRTP
jgi:hypothetical protein